VVVYRGRLRILSETSLSVSAEYIALQSVGGWCSARSGIYITTGSGEYRTEIPLLSRSDHNLPALGVPNDSRAALKLMDELCRFIIDTLID
jgi:hypothetical protein